jgi:hypothetical protein
MFDPTRPWINDGDHDSDLASFVLEGDDFVSHIVSRASAELHRVTAHRHRGFASAVAAGTPADLRAVVEALYLHLKQDYHLVYEWERAFDEVTHEQQVRLPQAVRSENRGTCIDLALLFLSCLANAKVWPIFVNVQGAEGHALAATWLTAPDPEREVFLTLRALRRHLSAGTILAVEATGFAEGFPPRPHKVSFAEACREAQVLLDGLPEEQFRFALDVRRAWENGVRPQGGTRAALRRHLGLDRSPGPQDGLRPVYQGYAKQQCFLGYSEGAEWTPDLLAGCDEALRDFDLELVRADQHFDADVPLRRKVLELIANARYGIYDVSC